MPYEALLREKMPLCLKNGGGSIWIQKAASDEGVGRGAETIGSR